MNTPTPAAANAVMVPPVDVIYEDSDSGETMALRVSTTIKDRSAYEVHAHKNGWPTKNPMQNALFLWSGFLAWSALRRSPDAPAQLRTSTPDEFFDVVLDVVPVSDESEVEAVNPTPPAHGSEHD